MKRAGSQEQDNYWTYHSRVALGYIQNKGNDKLTTALACQFEAVGMKRHARQSMLPDISLMLT
jgi:hypothetical protein